MEVEKNIFGLCNSLIKLRQTVGNYLEIKKSIVTMKHFLLVIQKLAVYMVTCA